MEDRHHWGSSEFALQMFLGLALGRKAAQGEGSMQMRVGSGVCLRGVSFSRHGSADSGRARKEGLPKLCMKVEKVEKERKKKEEACNSTIKFYPWRDALGSERQEKKKKKSPGGRSKEKGVCVQPKCCITQRAIFSLSSLSSLFSQ